MWALAIFADPATGGYCGCLGCDGKVRVFDPVAGGEAWLCSKWAMK